MTTPDIADLCKRLRADTPVHNRGPDYAPIMVEPGPLRLRAADTLERLTAEIERLREALLDIADESESADVEGLRGFARAALTGEDTAALTGKDAGGTG